MAKYVRRTIPISNRKGDPRELTAMVCGQYAYGQALGQAGYSVTHVPSGTMITVCTRQKDARRVADACQEVDAPYTAPTDFPIELLQRLAAIVRDNI